MKRVVKHPEERKEELIKIALELFLEKGFDGTSVKDIYTGANGSFGMFYHHFASKEEIFKEAMQCFVKEHIKSISDVLCRKNTPYKKRYFEAIAMYASMLNGRDKVSNYQRTEMDKNVFRFLSLSIVNDTIPAIKSFIEEGKEQGFLHFEDGETTATFLVYGIYGMVRRQSLAESHNKNAGEMLKKAAPFLEHLLSAEKGFFEYG